MHEWIAIRVRSAALVAVGATNAIGLVPSVACAAELAGCDAAAVVPDAERSSLSAVADRWMEAYNAGDAGGHIDHIDVLHSRTSGPLAFAIGTYAANNAGEKVDGRILMALEKVEGSWQIAAHEVVVRDQP